MKAWIIGSGLSLVAILAIAYSLNTAKPLTNTSTKNQPIASAAGEHSETTTDESTGTNLLFGGDIMLGRTVETQIVKNGVTWPLAQLKDIISSADISIANLESPFSSTAPTTAVNSLVLRGYPPAVETLKDAGIDGVSLANNHITDMGIAGLSETEKLLDENGIFHAGAGLSNSEAHKPFLIEKNNTKFAFLSYTYGVNFNSSGVYYAVTDLSLAKQDIAAAKKIADVVIVLTHFGIEYQSKPNSAQITFAHGAIDAGATLVIGAHPHVPEPIENYHQGLIAYSLGNLVFDQPPNENRDHSALLSVQLNGQKISKAELIPYHIYNSGQPRLVTDPAEKSLIFSLFGQSSEQVQLQ